MPVIKREQTLSECLSNAVSQQLNIYEATVQRLNHPIKTWYKGQKFYEDKAKFEQRKCKYKFDINRVMGIDTTDVVPKLIWETFDSISDKVLKFSMDDRFIPWSLFCAQLNLNFVVRCLRLPVAFVALAVLMYEAPKDQHLERVTLLDKAVFVMDIALNIGFLCGALVRFVSIPMMVRVERSFDRDSHPWHMLLGSGGVRDMPIIIACMVLGFSPTGMWLRLLLLISLTSSLIEAVPQLEILLSSITHALGSISITIGLFFIALLVYGSFGYVLFRQNDPYHFGSLGLSIWTFFRFAIFDSWADLWHLNAGGCDDYPTIDIIMDFDRQHQQAIHTRWGSFHRGTCTDPEEQPLVASVVFISFLFLCAYVLVNSCTVAVVVGIKGGLEVFKNMTVFGVDHHIETLNHAEISHRNGGKRASVSHSSHSTRNGSDAGLGRGRSIFGTMSSLVETPTVQQLLHKIWDGVAVKKEAPSLEKRFGSWVQARRVAEELHVLLTHKVANYFFLYLSLLVAAVQIFIDTDILTESEVLPFNILAQILFTFNVFGRLFVFSYRPPDKWHDWGWLLRGCVLTAVLWIPIMVELPLFNSFRMLRLVSALQYLTWIKDLELIMTAFTVSGYGLMLLGCLVAIAFVFFSVAAVMLFKDADPYKFGSIRKSMISLLQLMSYDGMEYMIRTSMLGCNHFGYQSHLPEFNALCKPSSIGVGWIAPVFCVIFCVVCSIILMSAMIGLIISSMESLMEIKTAEIEIWKDVAEVAEAYEIQYDSIMLMLDLFDLLDEEGHCHLTFLELDEMFEEAGITEEADQFAMFLNVDRDGSGQVEFPEFCELVSIVGVLVDKKPLDEDVLKEVEQRMQKQLSEEKKSISLHRKRKTSHDSSLNELHEGNDCKGSAGEDLLLMKPRMSTKRAVDRKVLRNHSTKSRQKTRDELYEHILSSGSGDSKHVDKFGRIGSREGSVSLSGSRASYGAMNAHRAGDALASYKASGGAATSTPEPNEPDVDQHSGRPKFAVKTKDLVLSKAPMFSPIQENADGSPSPKGGGMQMQRLPSWKTGRRVVPSEDGRGGSAPRRGFFRTSTKSRGSGSSKTPSPALEEDVEMIGSDSPFPVYSAPDNITVGASAAAPDATEYGQGVLPSQSANIAEADAHQRAGDSDAPDEPTAACAETGATGSAEDSATKTQGPGTDKMVVLLGSSPARPSGKVALPPIRCENPLAPLNIESANQCQRSANSTKSTTEELSK